MIYCSVKYCCSNSSIPGIILHSIMKSIKTPNHPAYYWSTLWPLEVFIVRGLYKSWWFCVHKLSMFICLFMIELLLFLSLPFFFTPLYFPLLLSFLDYLLYSSITLFSNSKGIKQLPQILIFLTLYLYNFNFALNMDCLILKSSWLEISRNMD